MKNWLLIILSCSLVVCKVDAQSKVFKQVGDEISTTSKNIYEDNVLVGYLAFTQLERASEDSFNYKITIMDENLNDIGTVNFRDIGLSLHAVAFDQDVLVLAYLKSNIAGQTFSTNKSYKKAVANANNSIVTQFLNLDGKIIKTNTNKIDIKMDPTGYSAYSNKFKATERLEHPIQLVNISQKGFACFYGEKNANKLMVFDIAGKEKWQKNVEDALAYGLLASKDDIYILMKKKDKMIEGGYEWLGYNFIDSTTYKKHILKDKEGNSLKVLRYANDLNTGKPYISGSIISKKHGNDFSTGKQVSKGTYSGVFTLNINGNKPGEIQEIYSYWADGSQKPEISSKGLYAQNNSYAKFTESFRDYQGNTYYAGSAFVRKTNWVKVGAAVVCLPFIFVSPMLLIGGTTKIRVEDAMLLKQSPKGVLSFENTIPGDYTKFYPGRQYLGLYDNKDFSHVFNSNSKVNYLVVDDIKNIVVYNIAQKKVVRTIPHKDGNSRIYVYPAKEGHIMVTEYNKKEKYYRMSIESL